MLMVCLRAPAGCYKRLSKMNILSSYGGLVLKTFVYYKSNFCKRVRLSSLLRLAANFV